ncbi:MAG: sulfatase-like hydrolase/transferase, partial [Deltaproteobacteria bacterium]|nr:sulfatase-like hydrolase/transferase [Deltaproteobacteria bacterium]
HGKYEPPSPYDSCFNFTKEEHDITKIPRYQRHCDISDPSFYVAHYDGEIKYTDYHIGQVLNKLRELGLAGETFVVFTSDHGETMTEHLWWFDHGCFVYEEQIHVPLLLWYAHRHSTYNLRRFANKSCKRT